MNLFMLTRTTWSAHTDTTHHLLEMLLVLFNISLLFYIFIDFKDEWPPSLLEFSRDCQRLTLPVLKSDVSGYVDDGWLQLMPRELWRGMSPKKRDEVMIMSEFVHCQCKEVGINKIVDLGSGLAS